MIKKKKILSLIILIIPLLLVIVGFSAWIISTTHKVAPSYTPNHTLADYFVENDVTTYNTQAQYPSIESTMSSNDSFDEESFVNSLYFAYAEVDEDDKFIGDGTYTEGKPTNAGRYSIRIAFTSTDDNEDAYYDYLTINKATLTVDSNNLIAPVYPNSKSYVTTQNTLSQVTLQGRVIHEIEDENIEDPSFDVSTTGTYEITGSSSFSVGTESYNYTYTLNDNYNPLIGTIEIETYAIVSLNKSLSSEQGSSYVTSIEVKGGSTYASIKTQVNTVITNNGLDTDLPGYTYKGVSTSDASYIAVTDDLVISANKTLFAHHELDIYSITYNYGCNDYSWASTTGKATYTYLDNTYTIPLLTRPNYTFIGWVETDSSGNSISAGAKPSKSVQILGGTEGDKYFKAYWGYTVNFYDGDKNKIHTEDVIAGGNLSKVPTLNLTNTYSYTFTSTWTDGIDGATIDNVAGLSISKHMNIYAKITGTARTYNVNIYYKDSDNQVSKVTQNTETEQSTWTQVYDFAANNKLATAQYTYGQQINVSKQIRVKDVPFYYWYTVVVDEKTGATEPRNYLRYINAFYKSSINYFDWKALDYYMSNNKTQNFNQYKTMVHLSDDYSTLTIVVGCEQPTAIVHSDGQASDVTNPSTTTYYFDVNDAFLNIKDASSASYLRVYGQARYESNSSVIYHCWSLDDGTSPTNAEYKYKINEIEYTFPSYVFETTNTLDTNKLGTEYNINSNMHIILPYGREQTTVETSHNANVHGIVDQRTTSGGNEKSGSSVQSILTIPSNMTLNVEGELVVGGYVEQAGAVMSRGVLMNNGRINISSHLISYGYIKGSGIVHVGTETSGATITEVFRAYDWPGGSNALGMFTHSNETMFPVECYSFHNVSCDTVIYSKSVLNGFNQINMSSEWAVLKNLVIVGSGGLFQLGNGKITKSISETITINTNTRYTVSNQDASVKDVVDIEGNLTDNSITMNIKLSIISKTITTSWKLPLPVGFMEINILSGTCELNTNSYMFLPGSKLYVAEGATLLLSNSQSTVNFLDDFYDNYSYDQEGAQLPGKFSYYETHKNWYNSHWPTHTAATPGKPDSVFGAKCIIDGTLTSTSKLGGYIQSNSSGVVNSTQVSTSYKTITSMTYKSGVSAALSGGSSVSFSDAKTVNAVGNINNNDNSPFVASKTYRYNRPLSTWGCDITLSYVTNNGQSISPHVFYGGSAGSTIDNTLVPTIEKQYYTFDEWKLPNGNSALNAIIYEDTTITANWVLNNYNINFVHKYDGELLEGVTNNNITSFNYETSTINLIDAQHPSSVFMGWYLDENFNTRIESYTGNSLVNYLNGNTVTLYSKWENNFIVKYNDSSDPYNLSDVTEGSEIAGNEEELSAYRITTYDYESTYGLDYLDDPAKQYYFGGWYNNPSFTGTKFTAETIFNSEMFTDKQLVLYAKWVEKPYQVTYGGTTQYYTADNLDITNRATTQGYETIWFTNETCSSETYYRSGNTYSGSDVKLYGEDYYIISDATTLEAYSNQTKIFFTNSVDLTSAKAEQTANGLSGIADTGQGSSSTKSDVTGTFVNKGITKLVFDSCINIPIGEYRRWYYTRSACGSTNYQCLAYWGTFSNNTTIQQVIIKNGISIPAYTFSNCGGTGKVVSSNASTYNQDLYWVTDPESRSGDTPQTPVEASTSAALLNPNIMKNEDEENTFNASYGLLGIMMFAVIGFILFVSKKVFKK